ncbi:putative NADH-ubiquinone oxidoreductase 9.5 kDa subunit [Catenaria anguillulae PL171]|uniref:Putative NADH-ubiquinone oxidoreductase 9.5 kDa subunit n=1 Tax=Catenaria anguillulae PL171 TaxID=765915 RepID=A0A1Y2HBK3_9FUNG|nr:putative NADH-ubiquinone oxidoreductase 9.5 kDa subunit [Catenaria anguillulae PL171]
MVLATLRDLTVRAPYIMASFAIGGAGIGMALFKDPIRRTFGIVDAKPVPLTYPMPKGPRNPPAGYED